MLTVNDRITIVAGNRARRIAAHTTAIITEITPLGADYSHSVRVKFRMLNGTEAGMVKAFYARHINRLADPVVNLNDGNPLHHIQVRKKVTA